MNTEINEQESILTEEALADMYVLAMEDEKASNWVRGDIAAEIIKREESQVLKDGKSTLVENFLRRTGDAKKSFVARARISDKFPPNSKSRNLPLDWTMFRIASGSTDPDVWLEKAHDNAWTCRQFNEELDKEKAKKKYDSGVPCMCGCGNNLEEDSIFLGGVEKRRIYFYSTKCVIRFLLKRENLLDPSDVITIPLTEEEIGTVDEEEMLVFLD